jgi:hypothetical protein
LLSSLSLSDLPMAIELLPAFTAVLKSGIRAMTIPRAIRWPTDQMDLQAAP